ncbi:MAG: Nucleotidyltransferase domain protein [Candidatus Bathyarchaeota archaeon BA1]|nr:MAG: Nucleotidyltransferase domain protein [Candidatus Bathyarchaeota archaeon BA1]
MGKLEELRESLSKDENVLLAYVFGSRARGEAIEDSDIDVAVLLKDESWEAVSRLVGAVATALKVNVERVDIVNLARVDTILKLSVLTEGIKLVDRGALEDALYEEVCNKLPEAYWLLSSHLNESMNPIRREY